MTHLRYRDYQGSVTFVDGSLLIQILHIDDLVTTQCDSAPEAQAAFEELVDDYIATCAELNKLPSKPFKGSFNVRVSPSLHRALAMQAADVGDTLNSYVQRALEEKVESSISLKRVISSLNYDRLVSAEFSPGRWSPQEFRIRPDWGRASSLTWLLYDRVRDDKIEKPKWPTRQ